MSFNGGLCSQLASHVKTHVPILLLLQVQRNRTQIRTPTLLVPIYRLHLSIVRLEHQSSIIASPRELLPRRCPVLAECVRIIRADEACPVALDDGDDGVVDAAGFVGVGRAAVGVLGAEDGVYLDGVRDAGAYCIVRPVRTLS